MVVSKPSTPKLDWLSLASMLSRSSQQVALAARPAVRSLAGMAGAHQVGAQTLRAAPLLALDAHPASLCSTPGVSRRQAGRQAAVLPLSHRQRQAAHRRRRI